MKKYFPVFFLVLLCFAIIPVNAQVAPAVRFLNIEQISIEESPPILNLGREPYIGAHFVYTFALFDVAEQSDRCYFKLWIIQNKQPVLIANWAIGFSSGEPPGLQGIYIMSDIGLIDIITKMAEFPYKSEIISHPEDGTQNYYFYKMHFYFEEDTFAKHDQVKMTAEYMTEPTFDEDEQVTVKLQRLVDVDGIPMFKLKQVKPKRMH